MESLYKIRYKPNGLYHNGDYLHDPFNKKGKIYKTKHAAKDAAIRLEANANHFQDIDISQIEIVEFVLTEVGPI